MSKNYKIGICGAHSQGKTTLVNNLGFAGLPDFKFRVNLTRDLNKLLPINEEGDSISQYLVMARHLEFALTPGRWVLDRCALDGIAYSHYFYNQGRVDKVVMDALEKVYETCIPYYDRIFYIKPELPLVNDGQRSVNKEFFDGVVEQFDFYTEHFSVKDKIVYLYGSVEERTSQVLEVINKDLQNEHQ